MMHPRRVRTGAVGTTVLATSLSMVLHPPSAAAQQPAAEPEQLAPVHLLVPGGQPGEAQQLLDSGLRRRRAGIKLTISGAVLTALSATLMGLGLSGKPPDPHGYFPATLFLGGFAMGLTGVPLLATGIPFTVIGQRRINQARALGAVGLVPQLDLAPGAQTAGLALRLSF